MENFEPIQLAANTIDLWLVRPAEINDQSLLQSYDALMNEQEREKQQGFKFAEDRHDALVTRAFVRTVLSKYADRAPQHWQFEKGYKGKPEIVDPPIPLRFNLSHTKGLIVCAVALNVDLGADVEYIKRKTATLKVADFKFSPAECHELNVQPAAAQHKRFFDYWTLKESYIKAVGGGLSIPLDQFSFTINADDDIAISFDEALNDDASQWQSCLLWGSDEHRIAISIKDPARQPHQIRTFQTIPLQRDWTVELPLR